MAQTKILDEAKRMLWLAYKRNPAVRMILGPAVYLRRIVFNNARYHGSKVVDRLRDILSDDPQINLSHFRGKFFVGVQSDLFKRIVLGDSYEDGLAKVIEEKIDRNRDAIDVGANCGFYTVLLAKLLAERRIVAIEPTKNALKNLRRNIELNFISRNVVVYEGVATDKKGETTLNIIDGHEEFSTIGGMVHPAMISEQSKSIKVSATTIDEIVNSTGISCGFIKIDVEGHEFSVLSGARETLRKHRPLILAELADPLLKANGSSASEVMRLMKDMGYRVIDPLEPSVPPGTKDYGDILCLPE